MTRTGRSLIAAVFLVAVTDAQAGLPLTPYWTEPGAIGNPNDNPLPPPGPSAGLTVTLNKGANLLANPAASAAVDLAAQYAESWIADPIDMIIDIDIGNVGGSLGESNIIKFNASHDQVVSLMQSDQSNHVGAGDITDYLPDAAQFGANVSMPAGFSLTGNVQMSRANAKALGINPLLLIGGATGSDGTITLSDSFAFDYDPTDGIDAGKYDFFGLALHEIGHIMGFYSEVDTVDFQQNSNQTSGLTPTVVDLFRVGPGSGVDSAAFETVSRDMNTGGNPVMYLGANTDAAFSTGETQGDGYSASHWKDNMGIGMLDPTLAPGEAAVPDMTDLRALDLIGWDTVPPASTALAAPLPATVWLFMAGCGWIVASARRRTGR